ncbi:MAG: lipoyl synthase [Vampirovibrio sp.]|nr:lipoyl synthase [Vampirovibrio sp.]
MSVLNQPAPETNISEKRVRTQKPDWLKIRPPVGEQYAWLKKKSKTLALATVCEEAQCPNIGECWSSGTATFMVMGEVCTRGCKFCAVSTGNPNGWLDTEEPQKLADTVKQAGWEYIVITSVDRDDLPDGGADHFAQCIEAVKTASPNIIVEVLIPDFKGDPDALARVVNADAEVVAQNIETVRRLTHPVRDPRAGYDQTMSVLKRIKTLDPTRYTKSSIMLGLGETDKEVYDCMQDLRESGVDILTLGQYLQPSRKHLPVQEYVTPEKFQEWQHVAEHDLGFLYCASGPLVRSSYRAGEFFMKGIIEKQRKNPHEDINRQDINKETIHVG